MSTHTKGESMGYDDIGEAEKVGTLRAILLAVHYVLTTDATYIEDRVRVKLAVGIMREHRPSEDVSVATDG